MIAEHLGLEPKEVYVTTISSPSNVRPRFFQSEGATDASVLVGMCSGDPEQASAIVAATKKIAAKRSVPAVLAMRKGSEWSVAVILRPRGDGVLDPLTEAYPEALMLPV